MIVIISVISVLMITVIGSVAYYVLSDDSVKKCTGGKVLKDKKCVCPDDFSWDEALSKCIADTTDADTTDTAEPVAAPPACTGGKVRVNDVCTCVSPLVWNQPLLKCAENGLIYERKEEFESDYLKLLGPFNKPSNMRITFDLKVHDMVGQNAFLWFTTSSTAGNTASSIPLIYLMNNNNLAIQSNDTNGYSLGNAAIVVKEVWIRVIIAINGSRVNMKLGNTMPLQSTTVDTSLDTSEAACYLYNGLTNIPGGEANPYIAKVTLKDLKIVEIDSV